MIAFPDGGKVVSYLPMAHVAERNVSHYLPMLLGFTVTCCPDPRQVIAYMPEVKPTWFFAVPRIWEKLKAGLEAMLEGLEDEQQRTAIEGALDVGLRRTRAIQAGEEVPEELERQWEKADAEVLSGVRAMLGLDEVEACNVGARSDTARGDRVLPRHGRAAGRDLGHVRDHRRRHRQPAGEDQDRHGGPARAQLSRSSSPRTARC